MEFHQVGVETQAIVVGAGPAGLAAALALGALGVDTLLAAPPPALPNQSRDYRTAALFGGSIQLLKSLDVWHLITSNAAPLTAIRIIDDTGSLLRAPEVTFQATEIGLDEFGWNIPNRVLVEALEAAIQRPTSRVTRLETAGVTGLSAAANHAQLATCEGQTLKASLVAAADGRESVCRTAAGIESERWSYPQSALTTTFTHSRAHNGISNELHRPAGPCTTVPMPGRASSLVWVERPEEAQRLANLPLDEFRRALEQRLQGLLGAVAEIGPRTLFPLSGLTARAFAANRVALVGEAAHVIPPIGAQGLNLGLRDAATLADCAAAALAAKDDLGGADVMAAYHTARRTDITSRISTVDLLNRSLLSDFMPVQLARGLGIHALKAFGPLRRLVVREGIAPSGAIPRLMQPQSTTNQEAGASSPIDDAIMRPRANA